VFSVGAFDFVPNYLCKTVLGVRVPNTPPGCSME
jgi:hypothetical protein